MVDKAKLHSPVHSTFEALVVLYEVGYCHGELNPFYWPIPIAGIVVFGASHPFAEHIFQMCNGFTRIQKAVVDQTGSRPPNSDHDLFLVQVWLWSFFCLQAWADRHQLYTIHLKNLYLWTLLPVLGPHCCVGFSLVGASGGYSFLSVQGLLIAVASFVGEHGL